MKKRAPIRQKRRTEPLWGGPEEEGITFSLLCKFITCRERFRLRVVEGLTADEAFNESIEFGNMWHDAEEADLQGNDPLKAMQKRYERWRQQYPGMDSDTRKLYRVCKVTFPLYKYYWSQNEVEKKRKRIFEEQEFRVPYVLPSGRIVTLRGKIDAGLRNDLDIYIQENKTKNRVDEDGLLSTLQGNLQTGMYQVVLREAFQQEEQPSKSHAPKMDFGIGHKIKLPEIPRTKAYKLKGVLYNVIRRPLADTFSIRQRKKESEDQFYDRVADMIRQDWDNPQMKSSYFFRYLVEMEESDIQTFKDHVFNPILEQLCDWWDWIMCDPFDPWRARSAEELCIKGLDPDDYCHNKIHFQFPWGVYNSLATGLRGDYFDYLTAGKRAGLRQIQNLFPELSS